MAFKFEQWGRLGADECAKNARDLANRSIEDYSLFTAYQQIVPCPATSKVRVPEVTLEHPNLRSKVGYGTPDGCAVDVDTTLKFESGVRPKCRQQLFSRVFQAVPNLRPGNPNPAEEAALLQGVSTSTLECSDLPARKTLTEKQFDTFVPLLPVYQATIQNPHNLVESWTRGGDHTREYIHTDDFKKMCRPAQRV